VARLCFDKPCQIQRCTSHLVLLDSDCSMRMQYNKSDDIEAQMLQRTAEARSGLSMSRDPECRVLITVVLFRAKAQAAGTGWKSEYGTKCSIAICSLEADSVGD